MGLFGTILSVIPAIATVVGKLFGAKSNDYIRFPLQANDNPKYKVWDGHVYFEKDIEGRIIFHNGSDCPVHLSMEKKTTVTAPVSNDITVGSYSFTDVTDMLSANALKNVGRIRISTNIASQDNAVIVMNCKGRLDRSILTPILIGQYISAQWKEDDIIIIAHDGCMIKEISSLYISGEGNEPENCYENVTPGEEPVNGINGAIESLRKESSTIVTLKNAAAPYTYSDVLTLDMNLQCEIAGVMQSRLTAEEHRKQFEKPDWDFLRKGRCLN
ncbi:hypothetical protein [Phocaeicola sp.]